MRFAFQKMHGLGNDFVVIDARTTSIAISKARVRALADRHRGIGCDQVIVIESSLEADAKMRIFNADGSEAEACGNAARAVALLLGPAQLETAGGPIGLDTTEDGATIDMGTPKFEWDAIPLAYALDTRALPLAWEELSTPAALNVGNPHVVFFVDDCDAIDLERLGPLIENDPLFPDRINVGVATVTGNRTIRLRVWERGAGLTRACGTGACAAAVAAIRARLVSAPITVSLAGGDLVIDWREGGSISMTGPACHVFSGEAEWAAFGG